MKKYSAEIPLDCFALTSLHLIAGGYMFSDGLRTGKIYFYDLSNISICREIKTSGTLDIKVDCKNLYSANSKDVCGVLLENNEITSFKTTHINTYVSLLDGSVVVSDVCGGVSVYDRCLNRVLFLKITEDPIWVSEFFDGEIICGCEDGSLRFIDKRTGKEHFVMRRSSGITSLYLYSGYLYVGSYDEHVEVIDRRNNSIVRRSRIGGGVWRILNRNGRFYMSCMYEGLKICEADLCVFMNYRTESIVYGMTASDEEVFFSSFYDMKIYVIKVLEGRYLEKDV